MASFASPPGTPAPLTRYSSRMRQSPISSPWKSSRGVAPTPTRLSSPPINDQQNTFMDADETGSFRIEKSITRTYDEKIFAKSSELTVSSYATLPQEVREVLQNADTSEVYSGAVDTVIGFALIVSVQTCFAWQYVQTTRGTPIMCYIFPCPQHDGVTKLPLYAFLPQSTDREPGLILVSVYGQVRIWDSVGAGLAGGKNFTTVELNLMEDERVTNLVRFNAKTFFIGTSSGQLLRLILTPTGGQYHLVSRLFSRPVPSNSLSRFIPSFFGSSNISPVVVTNACVNSIALGKPSAAGGCIVWTLVGERIQKWELKPEGWEDLLSDIDVLTLLESAIRGASGVTDELSNLELIDLGYESEDKLVVLGSYVLTEEVTTGGSEECEIFMLARLSAQKDTFVIENIKVIPYQRASASKSSPRIQFLAGGAIIVVQFSDAVVLVARDSGYRDRLELKSATDRILGVGAYETNGTLLISTASIMMRVTVDKEKINTFDHQTGHMSIVKQIMMQAIVYGTLNENPLQFSFPPEADAESLMQAAEQLSSAVLRSATEIIRKNHDSTSQLFSRKECLNLLIRFINANSVLEKFSQTSRQQLLTDSEKMSAGHQLWLQYNSLLSTNPQLSVLSDAVNVFMANIHEGPYEDVLRAFFRLRTADIGRLIKQVGDTAISTAHNKGHDVTEVLFEAVLIVLTILRSAFEFRLANHSLYAIEFPMVNPWTSRPAVIDAVLALFNASAEATEVHIGGTQPALRRQLPELAEILLACFRERLQWLCSGLAADEPSDKEELEQRFGLLRSEVLETLMRYGYEYPAFTLGEVHCDFRSLVALCNSGTVYPPNQNPNAERIQTYIDKYQEEFTRELYQWYVQHGELRVMFSREDKQGYLGNFFAEKPNPAISWLDDIGKENFDAASSALLHEAQGTQNLEVKHVMLSLGRLAYMAQVYDKGSSLDEDILGQFHDELDLISVHETLLEDFESVLTGAHGRRPLEDQIDIVVASKAAQLTERGGMLHVFKDSVRQVLQGKVLPVEDVADVLTLKDNRETPDDYGIALQLVSRTLTLSEARKKSALRTIWRRVYLADNWNDIRKTANMSDAEVDECLKDTALYGVLFYQLSRYKEEDFEVKPDKVTPDEALELSQPEELVSRWSAMSPEQLDAIMNDYVQEMDALGDYDLDEELLMRVYELASHDVALEQ